MVEPPVLVEIRGRIGHVRLNRPHAMNAVTIELASGLEAAIRELGADEAVSVIAISGAGGNFCAGGDVREVERLREAGPGALRGLFERFHRACAAVAAVPQPVVAVVDGVAMAGGFELALAADLAIASSDARIADNHINLGMIPGGGSTQRLPRLVGRSAATGLLLTGDRLSGREAEARGVVYRCFPAETFQDDAARLLETMGGRRRDALVAIKRLVHVGLTAPLEQGIAEETDAVVAHVVGLAGAAGVTAFETREDSA